MADSPQRFNRLYQMLRDFSQQTHGWQDAIRYQTKPDERYDLTLPALRVYGDRGEFLVIQAAAGLDSPELELSERELVLPTPERLREMKTRAGFDAARGLV